MDVEDKVIKLKKEKGKIGGDLMTQEKYQFFELQLEWCLPKPGNSGLFFGLEKPMVLLTKPVRRCRFFIK